MIASGYNHRRVDMEKVYDIQQIMDLLPHRYPFLLVDRVLTLIPGERAVGFKNVTVNEPFFQGHFPGIPVMPGVMIIEALAQLGGLLYSNSTPRDNPDELVYIIGMDGVRFRKPVVPGDRLTLEVSFIKQRRRAAKIAGRATVEERLVAEGELMACYGDKP
jgi:3-hydroxyacyl-[acyl-carrier-protein] dehydratase